MQRVDRRRQRFCHQILNEQMREQAAVTQAGDLDGTGTMRGRRRRRRHARPRRRRRRAEDRRRARGNILARRARGSHSTHTPQFWTRRSSKNAHNNELSNYRAQLRKEGKCFDVSKDGAHRGVGCRKRGNRGNAGRGGRFTGNNYRGRTPTVSLEDVFPQVADLEKVAHPLLHVLLRYLHVLARLPHHTMRHKTRGTITITITITSGGSGVR